MYYCVYKITNLVNGKFYIGAHQTENLDDGYMGSGHLIRYAIKKYGLESFAKEILVMADSKQEMFDKERDIVNEDFIKDPLSYNLKVGGQGGDNKKGHLEYYKNLKRIRSLEYRSAHPESVIRYKNFLLEGRKAGQHVRTQKYLSDVEYANKWKERMKVVNLCSQSEQAKVKRKQTLADIKHQQGENNSQFGSIWITNGINNKKIQKDDTIPEGWNKGRKIKIIQE